MATNPIGTYIILGILGFGMIIGWVLPGDQSGSIECTSANGVCPTYALNYATRASGILNLNKVLLQSTSTVNCTGITSQALTLKSSPHILVTGTYQAESTNITGLLVSVSIVVSTNVPATVFQSGACAAHNNGLTSTVGMYFPIIQTGTVGTSLPFSLTFDGATVGSTYYAWIDIQQQNGPGHVKFSSLGSNQYAWITAVELR